MQYRTDPHARGGLFACFRRGVTQRQIGVGDFRTRLLENTPDPDVLRTDAPLIVLLHGFGDNADTWHAVLVQLARLGHRAVAPDLPGFGEASHLGHGAMLPQYDVFLTRLIAELADSRPVVVAGNSMGGTIALRAATGRDDVAAVAALAPAGLGFHRVLYVADRVLGPLVPVLRVAYRVPYPRLAVQLFIAGYYRARLAPGIANAWRFGAGIDGMRDVRRMGAHGLVLMREIEDGPFDFDAFVGEIVLMWGTDDEVCDVSGAARLLARVPTARLVMLDGAGHVPQVQLPDLVAQQLVRLGASAPNLSLVEPIAVQEKS